MIRGFVRFLHKNSSYWFVGAPAAVVGSFAGFCRSADRMRNSGAACQALKRTAGTAARVGPVGDALRLAPANGKAHNGVADYGRNHRHRQERNPERLDAGWASEDHPDTTGIEIRQAAQVGERASSHANLS